MDLTGFLTIATLLTRTVALALLLLLTVYFAQAKGPLVRPFRDHFAALAVLFAWVSSGSIADVMGYIDGASRMIDYAVSWIFVPNLIVDVALASLVWRLWQGDEP